MGTFDEFFFEAQNWQLRYLIDCTHKRYPQPGAPSEKGNVDIDLITHKRFPQLVVTSKIGNVVIDLISFTQDVHSLPQ